MGRRAPPAAGGDPLLGARMLRSRRARGRRHRAGTGRARGARARRHRAFSRARAGSANRKFSSRAATRLRRCASTKGYVRVCATSSARHRRPSCARSKSGSCVAECRSGRRRSGAREKALNPAGRLPSSCGLLRRRAHAAAVPETFRFGSWRIGQQFGPKCPAVGRHHCDSGRDGRHLRAAPPPGSAQAAAVILPGKRCNGRVVEAHRACSCDHDRFMLTLSPVGEGKRVASLADFVQGGEQQFGPLASAGR